MAIKTHRAQVQEGPPGPRLTGPCPGMHLLFNKPRATARGDTLASCKACIDHACKDTPSLEGYSSASFTYDAYGSAGFTRTVGVVLTVNPRKLLNNDAKRAVYDAVLKHYNVYHPSTLPPDDNPALKENKGAPLSNLASTRATLTTIDIAAQDGTSDGAQMTVDSDLPTDTTATATTPSLDVADPPSHYFNWPIGTVKQNRGQMAVLFITAGPTSPPFGSDAAVIERVSADLEDFLEPGAYTGANRIWTQNKNGGNKEVKMFHCRIEHRYEMQQALQWKTEILAGGYLCFLEAFPNSTEPAHAWESAVELGFHADDSDLEADLLYWYNKAKSLNLKAAPADCRVITMGQRIWFGVTFDSFADQSLFNSSFTLPAEYRPTSQGKARLPENLFVLNCNGLRCASDREQDEKTKSTTVAIEKNEKAAKKGNDNVMAALNQFKDDVKGEIKQAAVESSRQINRLEESNTTQHQQAKFDNAQRFNAIEIAAVQLQLHNRESQMTQHTSTLAITSARSTLQGLKTELRRETKRLKDMRKSNSDASADDIEELEGEIADLQKDIDAQDAIIEEANAAVVASFSMPPAAIQAAPQMPQPRQQIEGAPGRFSEIPSNAPTPSPPAKGPASDPFKEKVDKPAPTGGSSMDFLNQLHPAKVPATGATDTNAATAKDTNAATANESQPPADTETSQSLEAGPEKVTQMETDDTAGSGEPSAGDGQLKSAPTAEGGLPTGGSDNEPGPPASEADVEDQTMVQDGLVPGGDHSDAEVSVVDDSQPKSVVEDSQPKSDSEDDTTPTKRSAKEMKKFAAKASGIKDTVPSPRTNMALVSHVKSFRLCRKLTHLQIAEERNVRGTPYAHRRKIAQVRRSRTQCALRHQRPPQSNCESSEGGGSKGSERYLGQGADRTRRALIDGFSEGSEAVHRVTRPAIHTLFALFLVAAFRCLGMPLWFCMVLLLTGAQTVTAGGSAVTALAQNANGIVNESVKSGQILAMIVHFLPTFAGITETNLLAGTASPIWLQQYRSIVNPAQKRRGTSTAGKWGVQMLIRKDIALNGLPVKIPPILAGRACFQDVWLTSENAPPALYRFGVVYGISGQSDIETVQFWAAIATIVKAGPKQWMITGDANVSLSSAEITAATYSESHASKAYRKFCTDCGGVDAWELDPGRTLRESWTYKKGEIRTIIDRSAASSALGLFEIGTLDRQADGKYKYPSILGTDHRPILTTWVVPGLLDTSASAMPENARPRIKFSDDPEKIRLYTSECEKEYANYEAVQPWPRNQITSKEAFSETYRRFSAITLPALKQCFGIADKVRKEKEPMTFSKAVDAIDKAGKRLSTMIGELCQGKLYDYMDNPKNSWVWELYGEANELPQDTLLERLVALRKIKGQVSYATRKKEISDRAAGDELKSYQRILAGQNAAKVLGREEELCMQPRVLIDPDSPGRVFTTEHDVKTETRRAFNARFTHDPIPRTEDEKHWMKSKIAKAFQEGSKLDPLIWPPTNGIELHHLHEFLERGNNRPSPGPDNWEKWPLKHLPAEMTEIVRMLVDYIVRNNYFEEGLNDLLFLTLWKNKGTMIDLNYFRGIGLGNLLHQMAVTIFTTTFKKYAWRRGFLPPTQGAANAGLQGRDLTSYISQIDAWAHANNTTLYWIKRDQKKGYDRVTPEAFDDACTFFGLPDSVRSFVRATKSGLQAFAVTAFGVDTLPIIMEMVMRQGGPFSPNEFTLVFAMASHWVHEEMEKQDPVYIQTKHGLEGNPHGDIDLKRIRVHMPEQMDDSCNIRSSLEMMGVSTKMFEDFGRTYGAATDFADASKTEIGILGKDPGLLPEKIVVHTEYGDFDVPVTKRAPVFLRTPINDPTARTKECIKIVENTVFPRKRSGKPLALAILIGHVARTLVPKVEARLALQPIKPPQAAEIDTKITQQIKKYYRWTFSPTPEFLNLKLRHKGLSLPSVVDLNAACAIRGLVRDLNHHIPHLKEMAEINFAQWQCNRCACNDPLSHNERTRNGILRADIPSHWEIAQQCMPQEFALIDTEQARLREGRVALEHLHKLSRANMPEDERVATTRAIKDMHEIGIHWLEDIATWVGDDLVIRNNILLPLHWTAHSKQVQFMAHWIQRINRMEKCTQDPDFSYTVEAQKARANELLRNITKSSPNRESAAPLEWASDGSMIGQTNNRSVTSAAVGTKTITAKLLNPLANSLHGELGALVLALDGLKNDDADLRNAIIHTDYLNAIGRLKGSLLFPIPGVHWYRWFKDSSNTAGPFGSPPEMRHVKAHTATTTLPEIMNDECDSNAKKAHTDPNTRFIPEPIFMLPRFVLRRGRQGYIETDCRTLVSEASADDRSQNLPTKVQERLIIGKEGYDQSPTNWYAANKSIYGWSLETQMLARAHALDTGARRLKAFGRDPIHSRDCVFCGEEIDDENHIFLQCPKHGAWRKQSTLVITDFIMTLEVEDEGLLSTLLYWAEGLVENGSKSWPDGKKSQYFAGFLPALEEIQAGLGTTELGKKILDCAYYELRKLTGRIFGAR
ncbi:hypothetical protein P7C70_g3293, partial [Phenoliferia sp. Uapishka_3]